MTEVWVVIGVMTVISFAIKAAGPVALAGRELPPAVERLIVLLPAALLTALVIVQTFADETELEVDERAAGVGVAIVAVALRANMLIVLLVAALTTAGLRAI